MQGEASDANTGEQNWRCRKELYDDVEFSEMRSSIKLSSVRLRRFMHENEKCKAHRDICQVALDSLEFSLKMLDKVK